MRKIAWMILLVTCAVWGKKEESKVSKTRTSSNCIAGLIHVGFSIGQEVIDEDGYHAKVIGLRSDGTAELEWNSPGGFLSGGRVGKGTRHTSALKLPVQSLGGFSIGQEVIDEDGYHAKVIGLRSDGTAELFWNQRGRKGKGTRSIYQLRSY